MSVHAEQVKAAYVGWHDGGSGRSRAWHRAQFDAWLSEIKREAAEKAFTEGMRAAGNEAEATERFYKNITNPYTIDAKQSGEKK